MKHTLLCIYGLPSHCRTRSYDIRRDLSVEMSPIHCTFEKYQKKKWTKFDKTHNFWWSCVLWTWHYSLRNKIQYSILPALYKLMSDRKLKWLQGLTVYKSARVGRGWHGASRSLWNCSRSCTYVHHIFWGPSAILHDGFGLEVYQKEKSVWYSRVWVCCISLSLWTFFVLNEVFLPMFCYIFLRKVVVFQPHHAITSIPMNASTSRR